MARRSATSISWMRAAADLEHEAVGQGRGVDRGDVAEAGLVLVGDDLDRQLAGSAGGGQELLAVARIPDRAGGDRVNVVGSEPVGGAESPEHRERLEPAPHRLRAQAAGLGQTGADPDGLEDLVGQLPPLSPVRPSPSGGAP